MGPGFLFVRSILRGAALAALFIAGLSVPSAGWSEEARPGAGPLQTIDASSQPGIHWNITAADRQSGPIHVVAFQLEGNRKFSDAALASVLRPFTGRTLTLGELQGAVAALLEHYRDYGYFATHAYLPAQTVENGLVRLVIVDGALDDIDLALAPPGQLESAPPPSTAETTESDPVGAGARSASLRFFDALPSSHAPSSRARASLVGSEDRPAERMIVEIDEGRSADFGPESGLFAPPRSDTWKAGALVRLDNPGGHGGVVTARGIAPGGGTPYVYGRFDAPLDVGASTLASPGGYLDQDLAEELFAVTADGETQVVELAAEKPLIRRPGFSFSIRAKAKHFDRHDEARGTTTAKRLVDTAHLSTRLRLQDGLLGGGTTAVSLSGVLGHTDLDGHAPNARADAAGDRTAGGFGRARASVARLQSLPGPWSLYSAVTAQGSSKNLDGSQRFSIGGLAPARGFPVGEALGDEGFRLNADLRYAVPQEVLGGKLNVALFYDQGQLRLRKDGGPEQNSVSHHSVGLSFRQDWTQTAFVHLSAGRQIGSTLVENQDGGSDGNYRFWLKLGLDF